MEKNNLWILTEERPTIVVIKTIIEKSSVLKDLDIHLNNIVIEPVIKNNNFQHQYIVNNFSSSKIENIIIKTVSGNSSFVDFLVFLQIESPKEEQLLENCIYAIEDTKTNTNDSRNTAMGQRSSKFIALDYYIKKYNSNTKTVMMFSDIQAEKDHRSVLFINNLLMHLDCGIEFWNKDSSRFKKFNSLEEMIYEKNAIAATNTRESDTPITIIKEGDDIYYVSGKLTKPGKHRKNYNGKINHDPNVGQIPLIAYGLRKLGVTGRIIVTDHQLLNEKVKKVKGNKFSHMASLDYIDLELENCDLPKTSFSNLYWKYDFESEKISSIFFQIILEKQGLKTLFDNHGGCEKSWFITDNNERIAIPKKYTKDGGKIPDLIMLSEKNKTIYLYEGKKYKNLDQGIEEIKRFDKFELGLLSEYYPNYKYKRGLIIMGGKKSNDVSVHYQIDSDNNLHFLSKN